MKIILATDFSESATNAAYYAIGLAEAIGADLILLHVTEDAVLSAEAAAVGFPYTFIEEDAAQALAELKNKLRSTGRKVNIDIRYSCGSLLETLLVLHEEIHFFAVVIGAHRRPATSRFLLGSKASQLVDNLFCPILVIPNDVRFKLIRKITLACDIESEAKMRPVPFLNALLDTFHANLEIAYVGKTEEACTAAEQNANEGDRWRAYHPSFTIIANTDIEMGLAECTLLHGVDIMITVSPKRYLLEKIFHRSISKRLAWQPPIPVAVIKV